MVQSVLHKQIRDKDIQVVENAVEAEKEKGMKRANSDQRIYVQQQEALAIEGENESKASIADYNAYPAEKRSRGNASC